MKINVLEVRLKAAPWLFAVWLVASFASCCYPPMDGFCLYLPLGPIMIDTWLTGVPVCGWFLIWAQKKLSLPAVWYWASIALALLACTAMTLLENPNRARRIVGLVMGEVF